MAKWAITRRAAPQLAQSLLFTKNGQDDLQDVSEDIDYVEAEQNNDMGNDYILVARFVLLIARLQLITVTILLHLHLHLRHCLHPTTLRGDAVGKTEN